MRRYTVKTAPRPDGDGWVKVPSVTYGGAPYFWHRRTDTALEWQTYDRGARAWRFTADPLLGWNQTARED